MDNRYNKTNDDSRNRLQKLVNEIKDKELQYVIYKEGWTVAVVLGHIAFWDERRLEMVKLWRQNDFTSSSIDGTNMDTINNAVVPFFLAMQPRKLAELTVSAAEELDKAIAGLPDDIIKKIEAIGDKYALDRGMHRKMHLDEIDVLLKAKRGGK
jgi:hypothetical protein